MESIVKKLKRNMRFESSKKKKEKKWFLEHGRIFLQKLIADCNGKSVPIRNFSASQIRKATNNFNPNCLVERLWGHGQWYKGIIKDKLYLIKRLPGFGLRNRETYNDIVFSARVSNHINFLKLIGCCFEFGFLVAVFEYSDYVIGDGEGRIVVNGEKIALPWSVRLKIAKEVAIAVTYLHTAFQRIIIHKAIELDNILLDKNWKAKLTNFRVSVSLPEGKSNIEDDRPCGVYGYMDPLYLQSRFLSEYTDVYSFGACLLAFLIGRSPRTFYEKPRTVADAGGIIKYVKDSYENGNLDEVVDPMIAKDITSGQKLQMEAFVQLAFRCCKQREEFRPKMIQIAKELKQIERIEQALETSSAIGFPKAKMLKDGPSMVKSTMKFKLD